MGCKAKGTFLWVSSASLTIALPALVGRAGRRTESGCLVSQGQWRSGSQKNLPFQMQFSSGKTEMGGGVSRLRGGGRVRGSPSFLSTGGHAPNAAPKRRENFPQAFKKGENWGKSNTEPISEDLGREPGGPQCPAARRGQRGLAPKPSAGIFPSDVPGCRSNPS